MSKDCKHCGHDVCMDTYLGAHCCMCEQYYNYKP